MYVSKSLQIWNCGRGKRTEMARETAVDKVERILTVLPWIVENQPVSVTEVCERFEISSRDLLQDLDFVFHHVGVHPFTPDTMTDIYIEDGIIEVHLGDYFRRPLKLNVPEALGLITAAQALTQRSEIDPEGVLQRAVSKLEAVLAPGLQQAWKVDLGPGLPEVMQTLHEAVQTHRIVDLQYYSHHSNSVSERRVHPLELMSQAGWWYLEAWCEQAGEVRTFRVDRIQTSHPTKSHFDASDAQYQDRTTGVRTFAAEERRVEIRNARSPHLVEALMMSGQSTAQLDDDVLVAPLMSTGWLERVMLLAGSQVQVTDAESGDSLRQVGSLAAERVLARYRRSAARDDQRSRV